MVDIENKNLNIRNSEWPSSARIWRGGRVDRRRLAAIVFAALAVCAPASGFTAKSTFLLAWLSEEQPSDCTWPLIER